ncbi:MAG TPA: hypothetical protein GXZ64_02115 [Clostridiaceae bacterium]|jgi:hypothetical protein|nr:hypothetical protein [Clostridiaceae bacterium]
MARQSNRNGNRRPTADELGFYLASSDRDLLNKVEEIMSRQGVVGLRDALGRIHYVVDGRKGSPYAARRIGETATRLAGANEQALQWRSERQYEAIDRILLGYRFMRTLRGYRFLRHMLLVSVNDPASLHPISKRLYPETGRHYRVSPTQVERNVRYLLDRLAEDEGLNGRERVSLADEAGRRLSVSAAVIVLHDQVVTDLQHSVLH